MKAYLTRRYKFSASHRLHCESMSEEENRRIYGKCNNPFGHGHNYVLDVSARGPVDQQTGWAVDVRTLDTLVSRQVLEPFDHRNLNEDAAAFAAIPPTTENLAVEICRRLKRNWIEVFPGEWPRLEKIRIAETARNIFEVKADEVE